jgi:hypothetical protein
MKDQIEQALHVLVGLCFFREFRNPGLDQFHFASLADIVDGGMQVASHSYALHVQCAWRIVRAGRIVVGSDDRYFAAGAEPFKDYPNFDVKPPGSNRRDERLAAVFTSHGGHLPIVQAATADAVGGFHLQFDSDLDLDVFPNTSLEGEHWRLLLPGDSRRHFVVSDAGIEWHPSLSAEAEQEDQ